jgi:hypothetical protein
LGVPRRFPTGDDRVKIAMAFLADEANVSMEGKLNVLGVFDRITSPVFPTMHPRMVFCFRVESEYADSGRAFPVIVRLVDDDGGVLFEANGELVAPPVAPGEFSTGNQVFTLIGTQFARPGSYRFMVHLGNVAAHETPLAVVHVEQPGPN